MNKLESRDIRNNRQILFKTISCLLILVSLLILFFFDIFFLEKSFSTSVLLPGTTPQGPYGFSGYKPEMSFSFDTGGNAWVNEPNPYIVKKVFGEKTLPSWNPYEGLGIPLIGNLNAEVFNPLKVFLNLMPNPFLQDIFFLLRLLVIGVFTYLFLKELKLSNLSSLFGASFFMLSGYSIWWINLHPLSTVMYLPVVFFFYERWSERKDRKSLFLMSLSISCALIAGKIPDVIMGLCLLFLYGIWKGFMKDSIRGMLREGTKIMIGTISGAITASVVLLPFIELYSLSSPLAKALRTGAASHTLPLITSVSLFQPLFLGWENYFYASWLKWTPDIILPHAAVVILVLSIYAVFNQSTMKRIFPYFIFALFLFFIVYGILPAHRISRLPILGSIEFLKYNSMLYFSLAVMSAHAFDELIFQRGNKKKFYLSMIILCLIILACFYYLYLQCPIQVRGYMVTVLVIFLFGMIMAGLIFHFFNKRAFGIMLFIILILELFLYMPKNHPDRFDPYREPPYIKMVKEKYPYRITGSGKSLPPLVSNAMGLHDIRDINILLPGDYYIFFENLLSFSVPQTNNPYPLFTATSPFTDLLGVKYILSNEPLEPSRLEYEIRNHVAYMRWIRLFDSMIKHSIQGGATYGYFNSGEEERFSFFFPMKFAFETRLRVSEPFIFISFAMKDIPEGAVNKVRIRIDDSVKEFIIRDGDGWKDQWLDVSHYIGKVITVIIEGDGNGKGNVVVGNFGFSPGYEKENTMYEKLLKLHKKELDFLEYKGVSEGIHIYENKNVMDRAFVLHKTKILDNLNDVINELQEGFNFREVGIVGGGIVPSFLVGEGKERFSDEKVVIKKYAPDKIVMEVESKGGLLILSDLYYPNWKVKVNGKEEKVIKAFGILRGVVVNDGKSEVLFYYRPMSLYTGIIISVTAFVGWILFLYYKRKK